MGAAEAVRLPRAPLPRGPRPGGLLLALAGAELAFLAGALFACDRLMQPIAYSAWILGASLAWFGLAALAARGVCRRHAVLILFAGLALRLALVLSTSPRLSDDLYRYVWEGRLQLAGGNPYLQAPADPAIADPSDPIWRGVNHKEVPAAYPPVCQAWLRVVAWTGAGVLGARGLFAFWEGLLLLACFVWLRRAGRDPGWIVVPAFSPLLLVELVVEGHNDSLALALLVAALALCREGERVSGTRQGARGLPGRRAFPAGLLLGLSIGAKLLPLIALPWFWRKDRRVPLIALAVFLATWIPFLPDSGDWTGLLEGLRNYGVRWRHNDSLFWLLNEGMDLLQQTLREAGSTSWFATAELHEVSKAPVLLGFAAGAFLVWRRIREPESAFPLLLLILFCLTPTLHPWYVCWAVPFLMFRPIPALFVLCALVPLSYHPQPRWHLEGVWKERTSWKLVEFAPFYLLLVAGFFFPRFFGGGGERPDSAGTRGD